MSSSSPEAEKPLPMSEESTPHPSWLDNPEMQELIAATRHLSSRRHLAMTNLYQILRNVLPPGPSTSLEDLLREHDGKFWTRNRIWNAVCDLMTVGWAQATYPEDAPTQPHVRFRGSKHVWPLWA